MSEFIALPSLNSDFARRLNGETGNVESICRYCFQTIAASGNEDVLTVVEMQHACTHKSCAKMDAA